MGNRYSFTIIVLAVLLLPLSAGAYDFKVGNLCYNINDDSTSVAVTFEQEHNPAYSNLTGNVSIPSQVTNEGNTYTVTTIGPRAFKNTTITSIYMANTVATIANNAFERCTNLKSVRFSNSLTTIGVCAFSYCTSLSNFNFPNSLTEIASSAFIHCTELTSVTIPPSVTFIGGHAFRYCTGLKSVAWNAKSCQDMPSADVAPFRSATITTFSFGDEVEHIPAYLCGGCTGLKSIEIPSGITSIGKVAFSACSGLETIYWNLKTCRDFAQQSSPFCGLLGVKSFIIGEDVERLPAYLCEDLTGLTSVTISESVADIGSAVFSGCTGLTSVTWNAKSCQDLLQYDTPPFWQLKNIKTFTFGDKVERIPESLCEGITGLTEVEISNSVKEIGVYAFGGCTGLKSLRIPKSVSNIDYHAFYGCNGLNSIEVDPENPTFDSRDGCNAIVNTATNTLIFGCNITTIPNTVTIIGDDAFIDCTGLTSVEIPNSVKTVGTAAFARCSGLTSVSLPDSLIAIGGSAFGVCTALKNVTIPNSVTFLGNYVFSHCTGLESVILPKSLKEIGHSLFKDCTALTNVEIPETVTKIGDFAFSNSGLTSVVIPDNVLTIEYGAFENCQSLTSVEFGDGVSSIGSSAFKYCTGLTNISIPNSVTEIWGGTFYGCSGLKTLTISNSMTKLGGGTLAECTGLTTINCKATTPPTVYQNTFYKVSTTECTLNVPKGCKQIYQDAAFWNEFSNINEIDFETDLNCDGSTDIDDLNLVLNALLKISDSQNADVTGDGKIDVEDLNRIINAILNK